VVVGLDLFFAFAPSPPTGSGQTDLQGRRNSSFVASSKQFLDLDGLHAAADSSRVILAIPHQPVLSPPQT
jgi:hypothetical protein